MALSLAGKTAIVTGAGSGINLAFTRLLLSRQCNVLLADLALRPEAEEVVKLHSKSTKLSSGRAVFQRTDVTQWPDLQQMFEVASKVFPGQLGVVCPGAGVYEPKWSSFWHPPSSPLSKDASTSNVYASLDINLTHPIRTTQLAIQHHLSRNDRSSRPSLTIVHISSIAGQCTPFHAPLYNAGKHALDGFVRTLAPLHSRLGIRVTAVAPGVIKTPLWTENPDKMRLVSNDDVWVNAEEVAHCMGDLASAENISVQGVGAEEFRSGKEIKIEGGMVVEISAGGRRRVVQQYMDPGPEGREGNTVGNLPGENEAIMESLEKGQY